MIGVALIAWPAAELAHAAALLSALAQCRCFAVQGASAVPMSSVE